MFHLAKKLFLVTYPCATHPLWDEVFLTRHHLPHTLLFSKYMQIVHSTYLLVMRSVRPYNSSAAGI